MKKRKICSARASLTAGLLFAGALGLAMSSGSLAAQYPAGESPDRAVRIVKRARDKIERNGKGLKASSDALFREFAERTAELQKLIDTRSRLQKAGFLSRGEPQGDARRGNINGRILREVAELKAACDSHLSGLLYSLGAFDDAVADALVDTQATRSINSNYELALEHYLENEKTRFNEAARDAEAALQAYQDAAGESDKNRLRRKYRRAKRRVLQIDQRRRLYEARVKVTDVNQKIAGLVREKIRREGTELSSRFRHVMAKLYTTFSKVTPIAEIGGPGNLDFSRIDEYLGKDLGELSETLDIVDGAVDKLGTVLDEMVDEVLAGLGEIKIVEGAGAAGEVLSIEEEMEFLRQQRKAWNG